MKHYWKPLGYVRYGDDFVVLMSDRKQIQQIREEAIFFLNERLKLAMNGKNDIVCNAKEGLKFLGCNPWPNGKHLNSRNRNRIERLLGSRNAASYHGIVLRFEPEQRIRLFQWQVVEKALGDD